MLISRQKKFIFVHVYKNAGSSIVNALMPYSTNTWRRGVNHILKKIGVFYFEPQPFPHHIRASEIIQKMGKEAFESYFSFAIVRNPWDWQVSLYKYMLKNREHHQHGFAKEFDDFKSYVRWRCAKEVRFQKDLGVPKGKMI